MRSVTRLDLANCVGITPLVLATILSFGLKLRDLDISGCKDLAGPLGERDPLDLPSTADLDVQMYAPEQRGKSLAPERGNGPQGGSKGDASNCPASMHRPEPPLWSALSTLEHLPRLRRLSVGWGFDGLSLRRLLTNSSDSLAALEVSLGLPEK